MTTGLLETPELTPVMNLPPGLNSRYVDAAKFCELMVSNRRMERLDRADRRVRGLRDLDTGEVFLIDARRLLDARR